MKHEFSGFPWFQPRIPAVSTDRNECTFGLKSAASIIPAAPYPNLMPGTRFPSGMRFPSPHSIPLKVFSSRLLHRSSEMAASPRCFPAETKSPELSSPIWGGVPGYSNYPDRWKDRDLTLCPSGYFALDALSPAILPNTVMSARAFPPRRFVPWIPPVTSPAA